MTDKITVLHYVDADGYAKYAVGDVSEYSLADLAKALGVSDDRFVIKLDEKLVRERRLQETNRRLNTPEAIRKRTGDDDIFNW